MRSVTEVGYQAQAATLVAAGVPDHAIDTEILPRSQRRNPAAERLEARALAISQCRRGDMFVVTELPVVALSAPDLLMVLRQLRERDASLPDLSGGGEYRWHPEAESTADALARWDEVRREVQTRSAREALREARKVRAIRGRLPALTEAQKAEARTDWNNPLIAVTDVAIKSGVSRPTLHTYFGPRFSKPPVKRRKRKAKE